MLVSSHLLAEVEQTCSHVVVMHRGRVVATGEVAELVAGGRVAVTVDAARGGQAVETVRALPGVGAVGPDPADPDVLLVDLGGTDRADVVRALVEAGHDVRAVGPRRRLEDAFLALIGEQTP